MNRFLAALLFSFSALAQPPVIHAITPSSGPDSGGTTVVITGENLNITVQCLVPCPPRVVFGNIAVDATEESPQRLSVVTPAHAAGVVDVTVAVTGRDPVTVEDGFTFLEGPESAYERVLLPVYFKDVVRGAQGTQWATDFWIRNGGSAGVPIAPSVCPPDLACPPVFPLTLTLEPLHTLHNPTNFFSSNRTNPSQLLYVGREGAEDVAMGLRVADLSRDHLNGGTEVPVIREDELLTRTSQLFDVPLDARRFRVLLRIYDVTYSSAEFSIRLHDADEKISEPVYGVSLIAKTPHQGPFRSEAAYAELDIHALLHLRGTWPESVRLEIQPKTPGSLYWAVASITNNETQLVTLITPQ